MENQVMDLIALLLGLLVVNSVVIFIGFSIYGFCELFINKKRNKNKIIIENNNIKKEEIIKSIKYENKQFLTNCETNFFNKLKQLEEELNIRVQPQVNLATIIQKKDHYKYRNELFRNIDFGIFTKNYEKLLLLIELNDSTHNKYNRIKRDKKVKEICENANIKLITFYTKYPNTQEYIRSRISKELSKQKTNN